MGPWRHLQHGAVVQGHDNVLCVLIQHCGVRTREFRTYLWQTHGSRSGTADCSQRSERMDGAADIS